MKNLGHFIVYLSNHAQLLNRYWKIHANSLVKWHKSIITFDRVMIINFKF